MRRPKRFERFAALAILLVAALPSIAGRASANEHDLQLPNLVPLVPSEIRLDHADGSDVLFPTFAVRFSVSVTNRGDYALELLGRPDPLASGQASAEQCVRWIESVCAERRPAGEFVWHSGAGHNHYHLQDFAKYELRYLLEDGSPDLSEEGVAAGGDKASFCIVNFERDPESPPKNGNPFYNTTMCNYVFQGISPGWMDTYGYHLAGQQIVIHDDLADGKYALMATVDPDEQLFEASHEDNVTFRRIELYDNRRRIRLL